MEAHFISAEILDWNFSLFKTKHRKKHKFNQPYEMLEHAETLLQFDDANFDHVKCFNKIQSAIHQRGHYLKDKYLLDILQGDSKYDDSLAMLQDIGFVKPGMAKQLINLHKKNSSGDIRQFSKDTIREWMETVWYFLKSTDMLLYHKTDTFSLHPNLTGSTSEKYWLSLEIEYSSLEIILSGRIPKQLISEDYADNHLNIKCSTFERGDERGKSGKEIHKDRTNDDITINGSLFPDEDTMKALVQKCVKHQ
jgi:hypothetical protein